jgi:cytochrome oxidase Cu insertion factor (SCO1/SenC/PrrC family)
VDPWRDSVEQVRTYLKGRTLLKSLSPLFFVSTKSNIFISEFHPRFVGLTGTPEQIQKVAKAYRVYYSKPPDDNTTDYLVDHSIFTYLLDRNGNFVDYFGVNRDENQIVESLKRHIQHREKLHIPLTHRLKRFLRFIKKTNATENK